ncbi:amino acid permease-domain-containing protein [Melampsora americana]|nr:amino acid permease-domain-containing protein [Melampsora americana]
MASSGITSPVSDRSAPDCIFETLDNTTRLDHRAVPIANLPQSNPGSEFLSLTSMTFEGRSSKRAFITKRPAKEIDVRSQRDTEAQLAFLGYKQELYRDWDFWSSFSLSCVNVGLGPGAFWGLTRAISAGGPAAMIYGLILSGILMSCVNAVLAEMASAYPVTGAMFTWTFKLARAHPKLRDWAQLLSWQVAVFLTASHVFTQVQLAAQFMDVFTSLFTASGYEWIILRWHRFVLVSGWLLVAGLIACTRTARSPLAWKIAGVLNLVLSAAICIALLVTAKHQRPFRQLFTRFDNRTSFKSNIWVFIYGSANSTLSVGSEPAAHLSEETKDAADTVPRVLFWSTVISYLTGFVMNIVVIKTLVPGHYHTPSTWPIIDLIFLHCPKPVAQFIVVCLIIVMFLEDMSQVLTAGRFLWALARDSAIPFPKYWRQTSTAFRIPRRATVLLIGLSIAVASTGLDHTRVLPGILRSALPVIFMVCYIVPLGLYLACGKDGFDRDGRSSWTLRGYSKAMTWISLIFLVGVVVVFSSPSESYINAKTWSWSPLVAVGVMIFAMVTWMIYGRLNYAGPVKSLTIWTAGQELELPPKVARVQAPEAAAVTTTDDPRRSLHVTLNRSLPQQTGMTQHLTYNLPDSHVTYNSEGSMWCDTQVESKQIYSQG